MSDRIGDILVRLGYVKRNDVDRAVGVQQSGADQRRLGEILTDYALREEQLLHAISIQQTGFQMDATLAIVSRILRQRLHQADIRQMLDDLSNIGHEGFIQKISEILEKTAAFFEISYRLQDSFDIDTILSRVVEITNDALGADRSSVFLHDRETGELYSRVAQGGLTREIRFPAHKGIAGAVFTTGQPILIPDAYADPRFNQEVDKTTGYRTRNILCAPVRTRKSEVIGVIQLLNKKSGDFGDDDLNLLEGITSQAAPALLNVQLYEQVRRAREEENQLLEVTTAISTELNLEPLLLRIMSATTEILDADRSTLFMHDFKSDTLWSVVAQGENTSQIRIPADKGIAGSVFQSGRTVNIPDAYKDERFNPEVDKKTGYHTRSILCIPVINKDGTSIGVMQVLNKRGGPFTPLDEKRLKAFSSQASIAIENAKLFEEVLQMKNYNEAILASMSNGVVTLDVDGNIVTVNPAAERILLQNSEAMVQQTLREAIGDGADWVEETLAGISEADESRHVVDHDLILSGGETISLNLNAVPLKDSKGSALGAMLMLEDMTKEKRLRGTMARYMTKEVAERLLEGGEDALGGKIQEATVFFSDIRNFTAIAERLGAQTTVTMLNSYFSRMVDIIFHYDGILDKYIGDAILSVFGVPFPGTNDADHAVSAAIDMVRSLWELNKELPEPLGIGIGIATDHVLVGNIGSMKRMDYTVIGDGVNLASRLEGVNKMFGSSILVSENTRRALKENYRLREVDLLRVKGKTQPVAVFEVLDYHTVESFPRMDEVLGNYIGGLALYRVREWQRAHDRFAEALKAHGKDVPSQLYHDRCEEFLVNPPPEDWDGCWNLKEK